MIKPLLILFFIWRAYLFFAAWIAAFFLPFAPRFPYSEALLIPSKLPFWIWSFANFDGVHYLTIAKSGYSAQFTQVFFPFYPLLIKSTVALLSSPILAGILLSNIFFFIAAWLFYKLITIDSTPRIAWMSLVWLLCFPTSFFFGSLYTESLFFILAIGSFLAARKGYWVTAGILGGLASATRSIGIFLLPALLWEWRSQYKPQILNSKFKILTSIIPLLLIPIGMAIYMIYLQVSFGDALYFWHAQPVFGAQRSGSGFILLPQVLWRYIKILMSVPFGTETFWIPFAEMFFTFFCIGTLLYAHKLKVRLSYLIFSWIAVIVPTLTGTFSSMPRYVLVAFPMYIVLAHIKRKAVYVPLLILSLMLLALFTALFTRGHWVS